MIIAKFGHFLDKPLSSLAKAVDISPNTITIAGFLVTTIAAVTLHWNLFFGGVLILVGGFFDMFDGIAARVNKRTTTLGAFLDSVLDRYSDSFLFLGFSWYFFKISSSVGVCLSLGTMIGSLMISYVRARAESLGKNCHTGLMERPERVVLMAFGALTGWILPVMWIMLVLTHMTAIQRIHHVWKALK